MIHREPRSSFDLQTPSQELGVRLFCFHGAGGVAQTFRQWSRRLPSWVEVCPLQLPGRLERMAEPLHDRFEPLLAAVMAAVEPRIRDGRPFAFFGHSLGSLLAFETARELRRRKLPLPFHLFAAARIAPHLPFEHIPVRRLDDDALISAVQERYQSIPAEILREPDLLKLVLRPLRADLEAHASYAHALEEPLPTRLTVLGGKDDVPVTRDGLEAWREHTTSTPSVHVLPGGHYFHQEHEEEVLRIVASELDASRSRVDVRPERETRGTPSAAEVQAWIVTEVARALGIDPARVDPRERFRTWGLDSTFATAFVARLGHWLGRALPATALWEHPTIEALTRHLTSPRDPSERQKATERAALGAQEPIAVIGVGCRFPGGANSPAAFFRLLRDGVDAVTEVPRDRWDVDAYLDPDPATPGKMISRCGGFVDDVDRFDAQFFSVSPREAVQMDPQQRLILEIAWEALEDARVKPDTLRGTDAGVFVGAMWSDYARLDHASVERADQHTTTGVDTSIIAARVSYSLGLMGPSIAVNTACSSSLVAVHLACQSLRTGESSLALTGGVSLVLSPWSNVSVTKFGALSRTGRSRAFDAHADGYVRSEGAGLVVLKPLSRALADGDRIYAVILGSAVNNDGFSNGLTAPNPEAQERLLRAAYANAGIDPSAVQYVEAHGTGTLLGDPIEAHSLANVLGDGAGRDRENALRIGSVKTNIGHTEAAAGIAGLIKVALAMKHGLLPKSLHFDEPNPHVPFASRSLAVSSQLDRWPTSEGLSLAGVSSFGFGGTNCHVVLQGAPDEALARIYPLSAERPSGLRDRIVELLAIATAPRSNDDLEDIARVAARRLSAAGPHRAAFVGRTPEELVRQIVERLPHVEARASSPSPKKPRIVWVCSGQGSQWVGMGRALVKAEPVFRAALDSCARAIERHAGFSLFDEIFATPATSRLSRTDVVQPVLLSIQIALGALWRSWGIEPDVIVGQSIGEVAAAHLAGILDLEDAVSVMCRRSRVMYERVEGKGGILVVGLGADEAMRAVGGPDSGFVVAGYNGPSSTVLSGYDVDAALERLVARGIKAARAGIFYATHSSLLDDLGGELARALEMPKPLRPRDATVRMVSTVFAEDLRGPECDASYWIKNERLPVRFMQAVEKILDEGDAVFVELSPHPVMAGALQSIRAQRGHEVANVFASGHRVENEHAVMLTTLAKLYELGSSVAWERVLRGAPKKKNHLGLPAAWAEDKTRASEAKPSGARFHLLTLSAKTPEALRAQAKRYADHFDARPDQELADVCHSATTTRAHFEERVAIVAASEAQAREKLEAFAGGTVASGVIAAQVERNERRPLAFLFTGQGSQYAGMGRELYETEPVFRDAFDRCVEGIDADLPRPLKDVVFSPSSEPLLDETLYTQLALFSLEHALYELWRSWGVRPDILLGHSIGELVAACAAGVMTLDDGLRLVSARARLMQRLPRGGAMAALGLSEEEVRREIGRLGLAVSIAAVNGASQTVISGASAEVDRAVAALDGRRLAVSHAFHSPLMAPMLDEYGDVASRIRFKPAEIPVVSNVSGEIANGEQGHGQYWVTHVREGVAFRRGVTTLEKHGVKTYVEIGPQPVLLGMLDDCLDETVGVDRLPSLRRGRADREIALSSLGKLWVRGLPLDPRVHGETARRVSLPTYAFQRTRHWPAARRPSDTSASVPLQTRVHVVDGSAPEVESAEAILRLLRDPSTHDRIVIREGEGPPLSLRLRRLIDAVVARGRRAGRTIAWEPTTRRAEAFAPPPAATPALRDEREPTTFIETLTSLPSGERHAVLLDALQEDAAIILGAHEGQSRTAAAPNRPLRELGFDSLMSLELRKRIATRLGRQISSTVAFDHPTLDALARYLLEHVLRLPADSAAGNGASQTLGQTLEELSAELDDVSRLLKGERGV